MQQVQLRSGTKKTIVLAWGIVCIAIFMLYPARYSILHGASLGNILSLPSKIVNIQPSTYINGLLISFIEMVIFCLIYIMAGILPVLQFTAKDRYKPNAPITAIVILGSSFLTGHWILSTIFFLLAYFYTFTIPNVLWISILIALPGSIPTVKLLRGFFVNIQRESNNKSSEINTGRFYWISIFLLFTSLLLSTSRLSYDAVALYFSNAKIIALTNRLMFFQWHSLFVSETQTEIQFSAIIQIFGDQAARMFSWLSGCVILVFGIAIAEKMGIPRKTKGILLALVLTSTAFTDLLGDGKVDLTSSAAAIAAVYWLLDDNNDKSKNLLAGFFAGLAMASRIYNVFLLTVFIGSLYLLRIYFRRKDGEFHGIGSIALSITWIVIGAFFPLAVHLLENWLMYHNAFAMLNSASGLTADKWQWSFDPQNIWAMRLLYPLIVTFLNTSQSLGNISPLFLGFLPNVLFIAVRKKIYLPRALIEMTGAALITLLLWLSLFFTIMEIRYVLFLWIILFIAISQVIITVLEDKSHGFHRILPSLVIILLGFSVLRVVYLSLDTYSPLDKQGNPQCKDFFFCDYLKPINNDAKPGERILSLLAYRYYLRTDLFACSTKMDEYQKLHDTSLQTPNGFWEEVYRQGYTYVAYEKNYSIRHLYIDFIPSPDNTPSWMELEPIYGNPEDNVVAYKINVFHSPISRVNTCAQNENGIWEVQTISPK